MTYMKESWVLSKCTLSPIFLFVKEVCMGTLNSFRSFWLLSVCLFVFRVLKASLKFTIFLLLPSKYQDYAGWASLPWDKGEHSKDESELSRTPMRPHCCSLATHVLPIINHLWKPTPS